ncbi:MAG: hypothetical protein ABMA64_25280 [Myxococcota bacterium]
MYLVATAASLFATPAFAGGIGVTASGGAHTEPLFYYSKADADGNEYKELSDYDQYKLTETLPNLGLGLNLVLGDRDDKITGDCRFYWMMDSAQVSPTDAGSQIPEANIVASYRETPRHLGIGAIGLSWGLVGDPSKFQLAAVGHFGSAFITADHTEFLLIDLGPGVTWRATRQVQVFGDAVYQARFRKRLDHSVVATVGARYLFD